MKRLYSIAKIGGLGAVALSVLTSCPSPITLVPPAGPSTSQMVATPVFSPTGGVFATNQSVSITVGTSGANIYYTTDGTVPTTSSTLYSGPISVSGNGISKAIIAMGALSGSSNSGLAAVSYKISHIISTIAGTGTYNSTGTGDNGSATLATLGSVSGIAVDVSGNYYIADTSAQRIRKVSNVGTITAFAGTGSTGPFADGLALTVATFYNPVGLALNSAGTILYVADYYDHRVRKITGGVVSTVAGTGTSGSLGDGAAANLAQLSYPSGVAVDSSGNIFIADSSNNKVRRIDAGTGFISTYAGNGTTGFSGDGGGAAIAQLSNPSAVAVDSTGNVYISDSNNNRIRKVSTLGTITTVAGSSSNNQVQDGAPAASAHFYGLGDVTVDGSGNIYFVANYGSNVFKVDAAGYLWNMAGPPPNSYPQPPFADGGPAVSTSLSLNYQNYSLSGIAVDSIGGIYIADTYDYRVRKVP